MQLTNKEILEKAIQKAIDNGWLFKKGWWISSQDYGLGEIPLTIHITIQNTDMPISQYELIYNHDFCRALWGSTDPEFYHLRGQVSGTKAHGSKRVLEDVTGEPFIPEWQYHLQQMVISENPIQYLGEHLDG